MQAQGQHGPIWHSEGNSRPSSTKLRWGLPTYWSHFHKWVSVFPGTHPLVPIHQRWEDGSLTHQAPPHGSPCSFPCQEKQRFTNFWILFYFCWVSSAHSLVQALERAENELQMSTEHSRMLLFVQDPLCMSLIQNGKHHKSWQEAGSLHCPIEKQNVKYINRIRYIDLNLSFRNCSWKRRCQVQKQIHKQMRGWVCCCVNWAASTCCNIKYSLSETCPSCTAQPNPSNPCCTLHLTGIISWSGESCLIVTVHQH